MSNNYNSNSPHDLISTTELGAVKEALGRLYKEFESFKLSQKSEREKDRAELQAWAQTNLIQNQLLNKVMATNELLTNELKNQGVSWNEFEQSNENLKLELIRSVEQSLSSQRSSPASDNLEYKGLKSEISGLRNILTHPESGVQKSLVTLGQMVQSNRELINLVNLKTDNLKGEVFLYRPHMKTAAVLFGFMSSFVLFFVLKFVPVHLSDDMEATIDETWNRSGYSNTKLQRVEKHLGTEPANRK